jgi:hypothetical protein
MLPPFVAAILRTAHVVISIIALLAGVIFVLEVTRGRLSRSVSLLFVTTTALTSITALIIHPLATGPAHVGGWVSIAILLLACAPLYWRAPGIAWSHVHVLPSLAAFYINAAAAVITSFQFEPHLQKLAPALAHPPLNTAQLAAAFAAPAFSGSLILLTAIFVALLWQVWSHSYGATVD